MNGKLGEVVRFETVDVVGSLSLYRDYLYPLIGSRELGSNFLGNIEVM